MLCNLKALKLRGFLAEKPFYRHVLVLATGTSLAQFTGVMAAPILTRLYTPQDFGLLAVYVSILSIISLLGTLQYENAIPLPEEDEQAAALVILSFALLTCMCVIFSLIFWAGETALISFFHMPELLRFLWLLPFSLMGIGIYNILYRWNMRRQNFLRISKTKITQSLGMIGTQIAFGLVKHDPMGLMLGDIIGRMGGSGRLLSLMFKEDIGALRKIKRDHIFRSAVRFKNFPLLSCKASLIRETCEQFPVFLLASSFGALEVGWFMLVNRIIGLPLSLIGYSLGNVYMSESVILLQKNMIGQISKLYWQTIKNLSLVSVPAIIILYVSASWIVPHIFGAAWEGADLFLKILSPVCLLKFLAIPVSQTVYVFERQGLQLFRELLRFGLLLLVIFLVNARDLSALSAIKLIALSESTSFFINVFISWWVIHKIRKPSFHGRLSNEPEKN